jgi:cbb3-type cytochrome oxidase subunit 3
MAWFLFAGDMLVMLFMTILVVWVSLRDTSKSLDYSAQIPLNDDAHAEQAARPDGEQHRG